MFALWCSVKSPLMLGSDLRNMTTEDISYKVNCQQKQGHLCHWNYLFH